MSSNRRWRPSETHDLNADQNYMKVNFSFKNTKTVRNEDQVLLPEEVPSINEIYCFEKFDTLICTMSLSM